MNAPSSKDTRQSSINALKIIYYVIIGLAITEALHGTFTQKESFIGLGVFKSENLPSTLLLFALLPTICRFVHGASIHLDHVAEISNKRATPLLDFFGFVIQASLFYLMAVSLREPLVFVDLFAVMLAVDFFWLIYLRMKKYIEKFNKTDKQWLRSNFTIFALILIMHSITYHFKVDVAEVCFRLWLSPVFAIIAFIATIRDYSYNKEFYFPM